MRRAIIFFAYDQSGQIDPYIPHNLQALRPHAERIYVVFNGELSASGRQALAAVADQVWTRPNKGFDVGAYRHAIKRLGWESLQDFEEVIFINHTFFGPLYPYAEVFSRSEKWEVDFWGLTDHGPFSPNPFIANPLRRRASTLPRHIQSHWIAVRRSLLQSPHFRQYWENMPAISSYRDSIAHHESRFTQHFADLGFRFQVAWPHSDYDSVNPTIDCAVQMLGQRCPILKRRLFFQDPHYLAGRGIFPAQAAALALQGGYPAHLLWPNLARTTPGRVLAANAALLQILPPESVGEPGSGGAGVEIRPERQVQTVGDLAAIPAWQAALAGDKPLLVWDSEADRQVQEYLQSALGNGAALASLFAADGTTGYLYAADFEPTGQVLGRGWERLYASGMLGGRTHQQWVERFDLGEVMDPHTPLNLHPGTFAIWPAALRAAIDYVQALGGEASWEDLPLVYLPYVVARAGWLCRPVVTSQWAAALYGQTLFRLEAQVAALPALPEQQAAAVSLPRRAAYALRDKAQGEGAYRDLLTKAFKRR